ncbi:hypothetical protein WOLCODRAFT_126966 [Wolfiporia cocos MD-104 SS10]|uniref:RING-type domain-containing protein n=1 Tax=Wolfiporia cocos (strain MD-104) TaxID=742152 RepID=A0A2H3J216_WOLCO|nr:hypothetical protein WOLCODRAFT_126966 [Wolfiporia cocos MD-104 SS10]
MADGCCGICLDDLENPVSTPCGHLHCEKCLVAYFEASADIMNASCPVCRAEFPIATPDLRLFAPKYHKFIIPSIRRVFLDAPALSSKQLRATVAHLEQRVEALTRDKTLLMERCESSMAASRRHAEGERDARLEAGKLREEMMALRIKYSDLREKYRLAKSTTVSNRILASRRTRGVVEPDPTPETPASSSARPLQPDTSRGSPSMSRARPSLRIQKRPRLLGSPFDPSRDYLTGSLRRPSSFFEKNRGPVRIPYREPVTESRATSTAAAAQPCTPGRGDPSSHTTGLFSPASNRSRSSSRGGISFRSLDDTDVEDVDMD